MKKFMFVLFLGSLLLIAAACGNGTTDDSNNDGAQGDQPKEKITLKVATSQAATHPIVVNSVVPMMEKITELTDGQVEYDLYPGEQLGKAADSLDLVRDGVADIGFYIGSYFPDQMPIVSGLMGIPGLYNTAVEGSKAFHDMNKTSPVLETNFLNNGVRPIFSYAAPASGLWSRTKEIKLPEDVKGLKVRVSGELTNKAVVGLNATPINVTASEIYESFERGVYDSLILNSASTNDYGLGELLKYGTPNVEFGGLGTGLIMNEKSFQKLSKEVQDIIVQVGDEFSKSNAQFYDDYATSVIEEFADNGVEIYEITEDEKEEWRKFYEGVESSWLEEKGSEDFKKALENFKESVGK